MVIEVIKIEKTINEIASENGVHPGMLSKRKKGVLEGIPSLFRNNSAEKRMNRLCTEHPEFGYRRICTRLNRYEDIHINRKAVLRHMREMEIQAIYPSKYQQAGAGTDGISIFAY